jgi:hypothetical protein
MVVLPYAKAVFAFFGPILFEKGGFSRLFPNLVHLLLSFLQFSDVVGNTDPGQVQVVLF